MAKFSKDNPPPGIGRPKGSVDRFTAFRRQLADLLPDARAALAEGVKAGDPKMLEIFFRLTFTPLKASYPALAIDFDNQSPQEILTAVKRALASGSISSDHAGSILDLLTKVKRLETGIMLAAREVQGATVLETVQTLADTAATVGDIDTLEAAAKSALPYLIPRPQPEPPEATGIVSSEPVGLDGEDWEAKYGNPDGAQND